MATAQVYSAPVTQAQSRGFGAQAPALAFDAADLQVIRTTFRFTAGLVLAAALACDAYLAAVLIRLPGTFADVAARQLATDLLPWTAAFTTLALAALALGRSFRRAFEAQRTSSAGFRP